MNFRGEKQKAEEIFDDDDDDDGWQLQNHNRSHFNLELGFKNNETKGVKRVSLGCMQFEEFILLMMMMAARIWLEIFPKGEESEGMDEGSAGEYGRGRNRI